MDAFSNRSTLIPLRFQIDPLWIAFSNDCVFVIIFTVAVWTGGENGTILLCSQMKMHSCNRDMIYIL